MIYNKVSHILGKTASTNVVAEDILEEYKGIRQLLKRLVEIQEEKLELKKQKLTMSTLQGYDHFISQQLLYYRYEKRQI